MEPPASPMAPHHPLCRRGLDRSTIFGDAFLHNKNDSSAPFRGGVGARMTYGVPSQSGIKKGNYLSPITRARAIGIREGEESARARPGRTPEPLRGRPPGRQAVGTLTSTSSSASSLTHAIAVPGAALRESLPASGHGGSSPIFSFIRVALVGPTANHRSQCVSTDHYGAITEPSCMAVAPQNTNTDRRVRRPTKWPWLGKVSTIGVMFKHGRHQNTSNGPC